MNELIILFVGMRTISNQIIIILLKYNFSIKKIYIQNNYSNLH